MEVVIVDLMGASVKLLACCAGSVIFVSGDGELYWWLVGELEPVLVRDEGLESIESIVCISSNTFVALSLREMVTVFRVTLGQGDDGRAAGDLGAECGCATVDIITQVKFDGVILCDLSVAADGRRIAVCGGSSVNVLSGIDLDASRARTVLASSFDVSAYVGCAGCSYVSMGSQGNVYVLSPSTHLLLLKLCHIDNSITLQRDGHLLQPLDRVACFACCHDDTSLLAVCFASCKVVVYQGESLQSIVSLQPLSELLRRVDVLSEHASKSVRNELASMRVLDVRVSAEQIVIATSHGLVCYRTSTMTCLASLTRLVCELWSAVDDHCGSSACVMGCAAGGVWAMSVEDDHRSMLLCSMARDDSPAETYACDGDASLDGARGVVSDNDVSVYSTQPLPREWLEPLQLKHDVDLCDAFLYQHSCSARRGGRREGQGAQRVGSVLLPSASPPHGTSSQHLHAVTFGHGIKSSGYGKAPWSVVKAHKRGGGTKSNIVDRSGRGAVSGNSTSDRNVMKHFEVLLPYSDHCFVEMRRANEVLSEIASPAHQSAAVSFAFSSFGDYMVTAYHDGSVNWLRYPVTRQQGSGGALRGHTSSVWSVDISLAARSPLLVSGSSSGEVFVWEPTRREAPYLTHRVKSGRSVSAVRFFYMDKFVLVCSGSTLEMHKYVIDHGGDDLHRARNDSALSAPVLHFALEGSSLVAAECINHFASNIVVLASSSKEICLFDVAARSVVRSYNEAHTRKIYHLAMCRSGRFVSGGSCLTEHNHFASAGLDGVVRLWDVRCPEAVRQFALHKNSALSSLALAFSPTGSVIAVGSEDQRLYLYDVRNGSVTLDALRCADVPTSCTWHPINPVLAVGLASGKLKLFCQQRQHAQKQATQ